MAPGTSPSFENGTVTGFSDGDDDKEVVSLVSKGSTLRYKEGGTIRLREHLAVLEAPQHFPLRKTVAKR